MIYEADQKMNKQLRDTCHFHVMSMTYVNVLCLEVLVGNVEKENQSELFCPAVSQALARLALLRLKPSLSRFWEGHRPSPFWRAQVCLCRTIDRSVNAETSPADAGGSGETTP